MAIAIGIVQGLLGLIFVITGSFKLFQSREKVIESGGTWAEDFAPGIIKTIAAVELISGLAVIVPQAIRSWALPDSHRCGEYRPDHDWLSLRTHQAKGVQACSYKLSVFADGFVCGVCGTDGLIAGP